MILSQTAAMIVAALIGMATVDSFAQQDKAAASVDKWVKSIGLSKPAMSNAPDFNLLDSNGRPVGLSGYRGRMVLLNFWATWCGPCREEMPSMEQLNRSFGDQGFAVIAINQREDPALVARFMKTHGLNFTAALDTTGRVAGYYRVYGIPVSYLIDAEGRAIGMKSGPMDWAAPAVLEGFRKLIGEGTKGDAGGMMDLEPTKPLPRLLRARAAGLIIRRQPDVQSESIGQPERGEELNPLGKVSGAGEFWYLVRTKSGAVGWVRGGDIEYAGQRR